MKPSAIQPMQVAIAVGVMLCCAVAAGWGLVALTKPANFDQRIAAVEQDVEAAKAMLVRKAGLNDFPSDAICAAGPAEAAQVLKNGLTALGPATGLERLSVEVAAGEGARAGDLAPLTVRIVGAGSYAAVLKTIDGLSSLRPLFLVDTVDLTSKVSFAEIAVSGRIYCLAGT